MILSSYRKKLSWKYRETTCMYDFEDNKKWCWTVSLTDHASSLGGFYFLKNKGYVATADGDEHTRFWKI